MTDPSTLTLVQRLKHYAFPVVTSTADGMVAVLKDDLRALIADVERLRAALKPFANIMPTDSQNLNARDDVQLWVKDGREVKIICGDVCVGDFWNATNVMGEK